MTIQKVGIIGAGTMGAGIAAHLANANVPVILLDIVTPNLPESEKNEPAARNRLVQTLFDRMANGRPVQLGHPSRADLITIGNIEDDFHLLADCDWVVEVIIERLAPKQALLERLTAVCKPTAILSSNTSGIPIHQIAANAPADVRARFLGTHFFNPPRYLKLLEIIPTPATDPAIIEQISTFGRNVLGKGVVLCKDTPNFIANRFGAVTGAFIAETSLANGYRVSDTDALLGPLIGRPKTGYFRLADLVGLDVRTSVLNNLYDAIPHDPYRELLKGQTFWPVFDQMMTNGWLGNKAGQGFSKKVMVDGKRQFWTLDTNNFEYRPTALTSYPSVEEAKLKRNVVERVRLLLAAEDEGAWLIKQVIFNMLDYAAHVAPEIAYSLADVDNVVRWGFNYELGPFALWDGLGVRETAVSMQAAGFTVADWVLQMLESGQERFYEETAVYDFTHQTMQPQTTDPRQLSIQNDTTLLAQNESASLREMGDGVLLLEFHSKANTLDKAIFELGHHTLDQLDAAYEALVIGNEGRHFSAGARLAPPPENVDPHAHADAWLHEGQRFMMRLRHAAKPIVIALHGRALGGGAELSMAGWHTVSAHDVGVGLVEFNVGRVPAWTGMLALLHRRINPLARQNPDLVPAVLSQLLMQLMQATVCSSAWQANALGYLRATDGIVMNPDHRLLVAKETALSLVGQAAPPVGDIYAAGKAVADKLWSGLQDGKWSEFDLEIGRFLIRILTGGVDDPQWVSPQHILDLEREASLAVRFDPRSEARMAHLLKTGKPLRN